MQPDLQAIWQEIIDGASPNLPDNTVELWLRSCEPVSVENGELVLDVANVFIREQVAAKFLSELNRAAAAGGQVTAVRLDVRPEDGGAEKQTEWAERAEKTVKKNTRFGLNPNYEFSSFVVGKSNRLAHAASLAVAETPGGAFNPLFIWGGTGLGKTHLMHAICHYALDKNDKLNIVYVSSEKFVNEYIESIHSGGTQSKAFKTRYRNVDVLLIDDIQFLAGKEGSQEEFFNTFNDLYNDKRQIIICSDRSPADLDTIIMKRLTSRMSFGMVTDIQPPDFETRIAILRKKASLRKCDVPDKIIEFLAERVARNIRELEGALNRVIASGELSGEPITISNTEIWLKDVLSTDVKKTTTVSGIQAAVAESFGISVDDLTSSKRTNDVAFARHVAMYLCRETLSELSLSEIAFAFKKKDHTTVIHAQRRIEKLLKDKDADAVRVVSEAKGRLQNVKNV
ncbi:chromosomal replication initiator protein DnaA [Synergistales bacterium]|nr:chromosomal replication initiator protein DnaA [Synergistales bacterium]